MTESNKVFMLVMTSNPHNWSSGSETLVAVDVDRQSIQDIYDDFPNMHYVSGKDEPRTILQIKEYEYPYQNEWLIGILGDRRDNQ